MSHHGRTSTGGSNGVVSNGSLASPAAASASTSMISSAASWLASSVPQAISSVSSRYAAGGGSATAAQQGPTFDRDLDRLFHCKIRPLLDAVDQLRGVLREEHDIQLPTIVVVGDQSSGKSSVLEALSGVALPRGREITTRCPLVLRLINTADAKDGHAKKRGSDADGSAAQNGAPLALDSDPAPYAIISIVSPNAYDGERIDNLADVGARIEQVTAKLAGRGIGVVAEPIYLSVFRAHSPNLTLVDLPGITRNPVGDQPRDIYAQIKSMIYSYINPETAVILNVMPATVDFPTSEGIMMSKEADPQAQRTIGVVTKLDLAEKGIRRKLENGVEQLGLRLGVVAVRNRNQEEIDRGLSFEASRAAETAFFKNHPELSVLAFDLAEQKADDGPGGLHLGTNNLAQLLTVIQEERIRTTLPRIKLKCRDQLQTYRNQYRELPSGHVTNASDARIKIDHMVNKTMGDIAALARGEHAIAKGDTRLHVSPRLNEHYAELQKELAATCSSFFSAEYAGVVEEEVREQAGICLPNFQSSQVFRGLMHREIAKLKQPATALLEASRAIIQNLVHTVCRTVFHVYPHLLQRVLQLTQNFLEQRQSIVMDRLEELLLQEEEVFTTNSYYLDTAHKLKHAIHERLSAIQQTQQQGGVANALKSIPTTITIPVNDLTVSVHVADLIKHAEKRAPAGGPIGLQALLSSHGASTLEMQINAFAYTQVIHKRLCDALPLLIRFHLLRALTVSPATPTALASAVNPLGSPVHMSLASLLQKEFIDLPDKTMIESMKEEATIAAKREALTRSIERMEKAMAVFEAL